MTPQFAEAPGRMRAVVNRQEQISCLPDGNYTMLLITILAHVVRLKLHIL
jgi:hypothetical protein